MHFGLLAHAPQARRQFGGVGLMVEHPGFGLTAEPAIDPATADDSYLGPDIWRCRVLETARRCREITGVNGHPYQWTLTESIDPHVGLGSGTQLALAVAAGWSALQGLHLPDATELARRAGRGLRSALGIHGFHHGGLIVEAGKRVTEQVSPAVSRLDWPDEWQVLLVRPQRTYGLCGTAEINAFAHLPPMPESTSAQLCRLTLLELLPGLLERDFETCTEAIYEFGRLVGDYFAPAQGGTYSTPEIRSLVTYLREQGIRGVGQTSWGPTAFVICPNPSLAHSLTRDLQARAWGDCDFLTTGPRNVGAKVETTP